MSKGIADALLDDGVDDEMRSDQPTATRSYTQQRTATHCNAQVSSIVILCDEMRREFEKIIKIDIYIYVCIYIYIYTYIHIYKYKCERIYTYASTIYVHMNVYICTHTSNIYTYIYVYVYKHIFIYMYINMYINKHTHICIHTHVYTYIYLYIHIYIYIYIHIPARRFPVKYASLSSQPTSNWQNFSKVSFRVIVCRFRIQVTDENF